ncbi:PucR family transcriptional regulator [Streptomyces sp. TR06-5]|uniref:PucR family transcriptional regulator n=1 Tax=unclassified Streptomyces TaxID=2593676 RepID=UPI0039A192CE
MGDTAFFGRLTARRDATAVAIRDELIRHVPSYGAQSATQQSLLLREVHQTWRPVLDRAASDEPLDEQDLAVYRSLARTRALQAFPFADFRSGFEVAHTAGLRECLALAEPGDTVHPVAFTRWGVRELPRVLDAVTESYLEACRQRGRRSAARELLLEALLAGRRPAGTSPPPAGYLILLYRPVPADRPRLDGRQTAAEQVLLKSEGALWRGGPSVGGMTLLVPVEDRPAIARKTAADLTEALAEVWGHRLRVAEAYAPTVGDIPAAHHEARRTLVLVCAAPDAESRPYRAEEFLVELALARQPDIRKQLTRLLEPLRSGTDLRHTLEVLFDCGLDRGRTAEALHLHRRSLTYRLQRIRQLSGFDPTTAHGIQVLRAALSAARLARDE